MESLREFAVAMIVALLVIMATLPSWWQLIPDLISKRFSVRQLLVAATVICIVLGACVAFAPN